MHVKIVDGVIAKYPYSPTDLIRDTPQTSFPAGPLPDDLLAEFGVLAVKPSQTPATDRLTQRLAETVPAFIGGEWVQQWEVIALSAEEQRVVAQQVEQEIVQATQARLDAFARTRNYDGIMSACTYATSPTPKFAAEGQYCVAQRDATWAKLYQMLAEVQAGTRPMPSSFADIEPELPALAWPA